MTYEISLLQKLRQEHHLEKDEWITLIEHRSEEFTRELYSRAREESIRHYGTSIYLRGLIEFTNYCRNDCLYCGIRRSNTNTTRYRLSEEEVLTCCGYGYDLGYRTFVLQGGEDPYYREERIVSMVSRIRREFPDCAITLSVGEWPRRSYQAFFDAGADRYLLRHETYNKDHYARLHPADLTAQNRQQCLQDLKDIGYQVGCGFMVGAPYQTSEHLAEDMLYIERLKPHMVGIGPFLPHHDTPFTQMPPGTLSLTLHMLGLIRLLLPKVLLPATTALGTIHPNGREQGILAGANVIMPNISPEEARSNYLLYDNKIGTTGDSSLFRTILEEKITAIGYELVTDRGDSLMI